jgi:hypothetical protein
MAVLCYYHRYDSSCHEFLETEYTKRAQKYPVKSIERSNALYCLKFVDSRGSDLTHPNNGFVFLRSASRDKEVDLVNFECEVYNNL